MSEHSVYDTIVVGAGIEGSSTAYQLAKRGRQVLLLEQFKLGHDKGSSHSLSRITRKAYGTQDFFTVLMGEAYRLTNELQSECGEQLFENAGCMVFGSKGDSFVEGTEASLKRHGVPYERFGLCQAKQRFPSICYPDHYDFILDKSGGVLRADRILRAYQTGFKSRGGIIQDDEEMIDIHHGDEVVVITKKSEYRARSLVLTLGPWASRWLPRIGVHVPLVPLRVMVCYWKEKNPEEFSYKTFPTFIDITADLTDEKDCVYGLPSFERPGYVKICLDGGPPVDPQTFKHADTAYILDVMCDYVTKHFPTLENKPSFVEPCYYTMTPDEAYILDIHPEWRNVVIGAGFSGQGFKLAPAVGCILADLAQGIKPACDMEPFKIGRFDTKSESVTNE